MIPSNALFLALHVGSGSSHLCVRLGTNGCTWKVIRSAPPPPPRIALLQGIEALVWLDKKELLVAVMGNNLVYLWDVNKKYNLKRNQTAIRVAPPGVQLGLFRVHASHDNNTIVAGDDGGWVICLDVSAVQPRKSWAPNQVPPPPQGVALIFISAEGGVPSPLALNHIRISVLGTFFRLGHFFPPAPVAHREQGSWSFHSYHFFSVLQISCSSVP